MKTISLDLRERIILSHDNKEGSQYQIAERYKVSREFVKKLIAQRAKLGTIEPLPRKGAKPKFTGKLLQELEQYVEEHSDATLKQIHSAFLDRVNCVFQTIHNTLERLKYTYKKKVYMQRNKKEKMFSAAEKSGLNGRKALIQIV